MNLEFTYLKALKAQNTKISQLDYYQQLWEKWFKNGKLILQIKIWYKKRLMHHHMVIELGLALVEHTYSATQV